MRQLGGNEPITLDVRNQLLGMIQQGKLVREKADTRVSLIPKGYPNPFAGDQAAYEAALKGYAMSAPTVASLEARLLGMPGPYWVDLTAQEKEALALWNESLKDIDKITKAYYPTPGEMDFQKLILLAIGAGAILGPIFLTRGGDEGLAFSFLPDLSIDRVPKGLPASLRPQGAPLQSRAMDRVERPVQAFQPPMAPPRAPGVTVTPRPGFNPPPRFSRPFAESRGISNEGVARVPGGMVRRAEGVRPFSPPRRTQA
jgi:hypothetical protein